MTFTQIKELFKGYNAKYFSGELTCVIELSHTGRVSHRLGDFSSKKNKIRIFSKTHHSKTENDWKGTIIHEMVHAILSKRYGARNCGHNRAFHSLLRPMMVQEFGIRYKRNRFHQKGLATSNNTVTIEEGTKKIVIRVHSSKKSFKIVSTGKIGTLVKESTIYGKKHITLAIEGMLFPFTTPFDNVIAA